MKKLFGIIFGALILLSVLAWRLQPPPDGKLVWVSDDNPRRKEQIALFEQEQHAGLLTPPGGPTHPPTGVALDVTQALKQRGISIDDVWEAVRPCFVYDGRIYGWPTNAGVGALWLN